MSDKLTEAVIELSDQGCDAIEIYDRVDVILAERREESAPPPELDPDCLHDRGR